MDVCFLYALTSSGFIGLCVFTRDIKKINILGLHQKVDFNPIQLKHVRDDQLLESGYQPNSWEFQVLTFVLLSIMILEAFQISE